MVFKHYRSLANLAIEHANHSVYAACLFGTKSIIAESCYQSNASACISEKTKQYHRTKAKSFKSRLNKAKLVLINMVFSPFNFLIWNGWPCRIIFIIPVCISNAKCLQAMDKDPYLWLEAVTDEKALDWVRAENAKRRSSSPKPLSLQNCVMICVPSSIRMPESRM